MQDTNYSNNSGNDDNPISEGGSQESKSEKPSIAPENFFDSAKASDSDKSQFDARGSVNIPISRPGEQIPPAGESSSVGKNMYHVSKIPTDTQQQTTGTPSRPTVDQNPTKRGVLGFLKKKESLSQNPNSVVGGGNSISNQPTQPGSQKKPPKLLILMAFMLLVVGSLIAYAILTREPDQDVSEPTDTEGEVVWWGLEDEALYRDLIRRYEEENANTKIHYVQQSKENYRERLTNSLARGEGPDLFTFHNSWVPMFRNELDLMPSFIMSREEFEDIYYPVIVSDLSVSNGVVGIPLEYDGLALYVNEDIFSAAGRTYPETWDQLRSLAIELTQRDGRGIIIQSGASMGITSNIDYWQEIIALMLFQNHASPSNPRGNAAGEAMRYFVQFREDAVWNSILPPSTIAFANGQTAMYFGPVESASEILAINPGLQFRTIPLPQLRRDDPKEQDVAYSTYWVQGVWKRGLNRGVAWRFLNFLSSWQSLETIYQSAEDVKLVGDPYPRVEMAPLLRDDPIAGTVIEIAPNARSGYLADKTYDGESGINTRLSIAYADLLKGDASGDLSQFNRRVTEILASYGIR